MKGASDRKLNLRREEDKRDTTSFISICAGIPSWETWGDMLYVFSWCGVCISFIGFIDSLALNKSIIVIYLLVNQLCHHFQWQWVLFCKVEDMNLKQLQVRISSSKKYIIILMKMSKYTWNCINSLNFFQISMVINTRYRWHILLSDHKSFSVLGKIFQ